MNTVKRLLEHFRPESYRLILDIDRVKRSYTGYVEILGEKLTEVSPLIVHAKDITLTSVQVNGDQQSFDLAEDDEVEIGNDISKGQIKLEIEFEGKISSSMLGMYLCKYTDRGIAKELVSTQFESHFARRVFPCIDEPAAKATFDLTLTTESDLTVLGNMPVKSQTQTGDRLTTVFETTPKMSTYLLAWAYGEVRCKSAQTKRGIDVSVYSTYAHPEDAVDHGLEVAVRSIDFFEEYYQTEYPLPKCDLIALPDFSAGAMENWGLITFRESCLLAAEGTTQSSREYIATVIAHELAHQWFGNLVTMQWWDNLWLNESFANVMMFIAIDELYPQWNIWQSFLVTEVTSALERDQFADVQAIENPINHPDEINAAFDKGIVYAKGSRLLRMLESYIGSDAFRRGLQTYFARHAYSNTTSNDLWQAFTDTSGHEIGDFMSTWISRPGFPVVSVGKKNQTTQLSQERFNISHQASPEIWPIPLTVSGSQLLMDEQTITEDLGDKLLLNPQANGHFITCYDESYLEKLCKQMPSQTLSPVERGNLIEEYYLLAHAGYVKTSQLIQLLSTMDSEETDAVWAIAERAINELNHFAATSSEETLYYNWIIKLTQNTLARLGYNERPADTDNDRRIRATIVNLLILARHTPTLAALNDQYNNSSVNNLPGTLRSAVCHAAMITSPDKVYVELQHVHRQTANPEIRSQLAYVLSHTDQADQIQKLLAQLTDSSVVKPQDLSRWYAYMLQNPDAQDATWDWMVTNWNWIYKTFDHDFTLEKFIISTGRTVKGNQWQTKYEAFFTFEKLPEFSRSIKIGSAGIAARTKWIERDHDQVMKSFRHA